MIERKPMKRYNPRWSGQRIIREGRRRWGYHFGWTLGYLGTKWMRQPTWARTMVYIVTGYAIGFTWSAWVS